MTEQNTEPVRFDSKIVVVVRADLPTWQKLNMTSFLAAAVAGGHPDSLGEAYTDADGSAYLATFGQPVLVFAADPAALARTLQRAGSRGVTPAVFTTAMFTTGHDAANRAAVAAVARADLDLAGLAFRTARKDADKITKGLALHS